MQADGAAVNTSVKKTVTRLTRCLPDLGETGFATSARLAKRAARDRSGALTVSVLRDYNSQATRVAS